MLAVDPERSSGIPLNPTYRNPAPASVPATGYTDPVTMPAADIAENPYWRRDVRRNYPRLSTFRQSDIAGLLSVGSVVNPRIKAGEAGAQQLIAIKEGGSKGVLSLAFEKDGGRAISEVLGPGGLPPLPGTGVSWVLDNNEGFPGKYDTHISMEKVLWGY